MEALRRYQFFCFWASGVRSWSGVFLYIKWNFVLSWFVSALFLYLQYCSIDLLYMCSSKKKRTTGTGRGTHHGHCKGNSFTGTSRTKALRARTCCTDTEASFPGPCIARAPELVYYQGWRCEDTLDILCYCIILYRPFPKPQRINFGAATFFSRTQNHKMEVALLLRYSLRT